MLVDGVEQEVTEQTPPPESKGGKSKEPETVTLTKAELESLKRERDEARESERFWAERAKGGKPDPEPEPDEEDDPPAEPADEAEIDPDKFVDELTKLGPKALKKYGFMTRAEAERLADERGRKAASEVVDKRVQAMQSDSKLVTEFAELRDQKSELFKATAPIYREMVEMNGGKQSTALMYAAAKAAKAQLEAAHEASRAKQKPREDDDTYDRYEPEADRRARIAAQGGDRRRAPERDDDTPELGPQALEICRQMGISEKDYLASQKDLAPRRRR